jgi:outer membrane protein OmpA-like peptidoglycan-associated protein/poly-gamma-glutamate capsule biosynthesis protein CapA/YwtB (metallophosphatase superfamily)/peptidoglycan/xylan/chitin deacetylase (PgdA/CDA1 family)
MKELILFTLFLVFGLSACSVKTTQLSQPGNTPEKKQPEVLASQKTPTPLPFKASQLEFGVKVGDKPIADITTLGVCIPVYHAATLPLTTVKNASPYVRQEIDAIGELLQKNPDYKIAIEGHTWSFGNAKSNKEYSQRAADSVKQRLVNSWGVQEDRILAVGRGAEEPIAENDTPEGRQTNRRLQLVVTGPAKKNLASAPLNPSRESAEPVKDTPPLYEAVLSFDSGAAILHSEFQKKIHEAGRVLQNEPNAVVIIEGHTDNRGDADTNAELSLERAKVVKNILRQVYALPVSRVITVGYGENQPLADNALPEGREKNRRVALTVTTSSSRIQAAQERLTPRKTAEPKHAASSLIPVAPHQSDPVAAVSAPPAAPGKAVVLCYHRFDENKPYSISSDNFERQIQFMLSNGYNIVSPAELVEYMKKKSIPNKTVLITIDDGWRSTMRAYQVLKKYNLPFTAFLSMQFVGATDASCLSMEDVNELKTYPKVTFANHSYAHSNKLTHGNSMGEQAYAAYVRADVQKSVERYREVFGTDTKFFAYPFGYTHELYLKALREAGFEYLFTVNPKLVENNTDFVYIPRFGGHGLRVETLASFFDDSKSGGSYAQSSPRHKRKHAPVRDLDEQSALDREQTPKARELAAQSKSDVKSGTVANVTIERTPIPAKTESSAPASSVAPVSSEAPVKALRPQSQLTAPLGALSLVSGLRENAAPSRENRLPQRFNPQRAWAPDLAAAPIARPKAEPVSAPKVISKAEVAYAPVETKAVEPVSQALPKAEPVANIADIPKADVAYAPLSPARTTPSQAAELKPAPTAPHQPSALSARTPLEDVISITAVGDIMMGTTFPRNLLPPDDGERGFDQVKDAFGRSDVQFGNLEGPLTDTGSPSKCGGSGNCYEFKTPQRYVSHLKKAGFNVLSVANNHANDFGAVGAMNTVNTLQENGIAPAGGDFVATLNVRGKKIAMLGFAHNRKKNSLAITDIPTAVRLVKKYKAENDLVLVSFHGGAEGAGAVNVGDKAESFCGENRGNVVQFARAVVDAGADMVLGHGPHVLRAMEVYKGKLIAYSLGNFLAYETFNTNGPCGLSAVLKAQIDAKTGNFVSGEIVPVKLSQAGVPSIDKNGESIKQIKMLTRNNLPQATIAISEAGKLAAPQELVSKGSAALLQ